MSKNFEEEYKALARQDAPDLWDRIEAGLAPKAVVSPAPDGEDGLREMASQEKTSQRKLFFIRYKTVIAAAVCVLVILPAAMLLRSAHNSSSSQSRDLAADMAMPEAAVETEAAAEMEAAAETAESTEEAETEEAAVNEAAADAADMADTGEAAATGAMASGREMTEEAAAEEFAMDDATEESAVTDRAALASTEALGNGALSEKQQKQTAQADTEVSVEIEVLSKASSPEETAGSCYEVRILEEDADGIFAGGETITLCQPAQSPAALSAGESCRVVIRVEPEAEYPYTLLRYDE